MPVVKRVLCPERLRRVPKQFSWIDHRLVRDRHIGRCSANALQHVRKIVALSEIYGPEPTRRAIEDALAFQAFSCEYIANLLEQRQRVLPEPGALHLIRRQDLLDLELPEPNLGLYDPACEGDATAGPDTGPPAPSGEPHEPAEGQEQRRQDDVG